MIRLITLSIHLVLVSAFTATAHATVINFDDLAVGTKVTWCYMSDPEGNMIELQSWANFSPQRGITKEK